MESPKDAVNPPTQPKLDPPSPAQPADAQPAAGQAAAGSSASVAGVLASPTTQNAIKLAGEAMLPGASLLMDGKILQGGIHLLAGAVAKAFLGPVGIAVVIANSYSNSTTGKNLLEQFSRFIPTMPPKTE